MIQRNLFKILITSGLAILLLLSPSFVLGQTIMGARSLSMGQTGTSLPSAPWAAFSNSALLPFEGNSVSFYGFRYVGFTEITDMAAVLTIQAKPGTFAGAVHRYGFSLYQQSRFLAAYRFSAGHFHSGVSFSYHHVQIGGNYGSAGAFGVDLGIALELSSGLWFGSRMTNLNQPSYGRSDEQLPREIAAGVSFYLSDSLLLTTEIVKDVLFPLSFRGGFEFEIVPSFFLRTGFTTKPDTFSAGFGLLMDRWTINIGLQQHDPLGLSPAIDMGIQF